ncbi:hypothetical protein Tco_1087068 [Tanacetum coccineum]
MIGFTVLKTEFQQFINSWFSLNYDGQMTSKYFIKYTVLEVQNFKDILIQHMDSVKKSIAEIALYKRESRGIKSGKQDTSNRSRNDTDVDDANIRPSYDEEPMAKVQSTVEHNVSTNEQQHAEQPEFNNEGWVDQDAKQCHDKRPLLAQLNENKTTELLDN